jgi:predicted DNA-binding protein with PD1-like motif
MESGSFTIKKIHVLRVDPGEDVLASVEKFLSEQAIAQAVVLGGYGTLATFHLHWVKDNRLPAENRYAQGEGGIEILGMSGLVVAGQPHIHVSLSTQAGAFGGHLEPGCRAYVLCEIFFAEVEGPRMSRQPVDVEVAGMGQSSVPRLTFSQD